MYCFTKCCRFCLNNSGDLHDYNTSDNNGTSYYAQVIEFIPSLKCFSSENFPQLICTKCISEVNVMNNFKEKCLKSHNLLSIYSTQLKEHISCANSNVNNTHILNIKIEPGTDCTDNVTHNNNVTKNTTTGVTNKLENYSFACLNIKVESNSDTEREHLNCDSNDNNKTKTNYEFANCSLHYEHDIKDEVFSDNSLSEPSNVPSTSNYDSVNIKNELNTTEDDYFTSDEHDNDTEEPVVRMGTPPAITHAASLIAQNLLLPTKSKIQYERQYELFMEWRTENRMDSFSENVLLDYFHDLSTKLKPSSLWPIYCRLRTTINLRNNINIRKYRKLYSFLKCTSKGYKPKKSKNLTPEQIKEFLMTAPDDRYLFTKVGLIFGIMGACRREEMTAIEASHVDDLQTKLRVRIPETKTKQERQFFIGGNLYNICKKYMALRPPDVARFFLNYQQGKCTHHPVGINKYGSIVSQIATFLKLPDPKSYTGHYFRKPSASILDDFDTDTDTAALKGHG